MFNQLNRWRAFEIIFRSFFFVFLCPFQPSVHFFLMMMVVLLIWHRFSMIVSIPNMHVYLLFLRFIYSHSFRIYRSIIFGLFKIKKSYNLSSVSHLSSNSIRSNSSGNVGDGITIHLNNAENNNEE